MCFGSVGSYYNIREDIGVYDANGSHVDTIENNSNTYIVFAAGYGYSKTDNFSDFDRARVTGRYINGNYYPYGGTVFADLDPTQHPAYYGVNTY